MCGRIFSERVILDLVLEVPSLTSLTLSPNRRNTQDFS